MAARLLWQEIMDKGGDKRPKGSVGTGPPADPQASKPKDAIAPGKIVADGRGRNVWHFHGEPVDSTSMMLQRLDNPALALEPTRTARKLDTEKASPAAKVPASKAPTGAAPAGKAPAGKAPAGKPATTAARPATQEKKTGDQSTGQSLRLKPGKNGGGGFDPYNRS